VNKNPLRSLIVRGFFLISDFGFRKSITNYEVINLEFFSTFDFISYFLFGNLNNWGAEHPPLFCHSISPLGNLNLFRYAGSITNYGVIFYWYSNI